MLFIEAIDILQNMNANRSVWQLAMYQQPTSCLKVFEEKHLNVLLEERTKCLFFPWPFCPFQLVTFPFTLTFKGTYNLHAEMFLGNSRQSSLWTTAHFERADKQNATHYETETSMFWWNTNTKFNKITTVFLKKANTGCKLTW